MDKKVVYVTNPALAPISELIPYLDQIWETGIMTHNGPLLQRLEKEIAQVHGVSDSVCVGNGTLGLDLMVETLGGNGEIITTPFSFPATSTAIKWRGCQPVFVDIDSATWNIDPNEVEKAITPKTTAILAVHVFSCPCQVKQLEEIAKRHKIKLLYDGAHAFGVKSSGRSIVEWGDAVMISYHATKFFNTVEGGGVFSSDQNILAKIRQLRFFGYDSQKELTDVGTNAKMTEVSAAVGLANLKYIDIILSKRRFLYEQYLKCLADCPDLTFQQFNPDEYNYSYFPVLFKDEEQLLRVNEALNAEQIYPRRYFWPLLSDMPAFNDAKIVGDLNVAQNVSSRILCLPLYPDLKESELERIVTVIQPVL